MRSIAIAGAIMLVACGGEGPTAPTVDAPASAPTESRVDVPVSGRVLDFATNTGVASVTVSFVGSTTVTTVTNTDGSYRLVIPQIGLFQPSVDGRSLGSARVTGSLYRGDLLVNPGICVARYGTVTDARTRRPLSGASIYLMGRIATTGDDGWYRLDLGCPTDSIFPGLVGFNTTFIYVGHPKYANVSEIAGRGVAGVRRADFELKPL